MLLSVERLMATDCNADRSCQYISQNKQKELEDSQQHSWVYNAISWVSDSALFFKTKYEGSALVTHIKMLVLRLRII